MNRWYLSNPEYADLLDRGAEARARYVGDLLRRGAHGLARTAGAALTATRRTAVRLVRAYAKWQQMRRSIAALERLDDHMLRDIGIDRSEIQSLINERLAPKVGRTIERRQATRSPVRAALVARGWSVPDAYASRRPLTPPLLQAQPGCC